MKLIQIFSLSSLLSITLISGCGGTNESSSTYTYSTTSSKGDYSEWSIVDNNLTAIWNVITTDGAIAYSYDIAATCGGADADGVRDCAVTSSSCTDGVSVCMDVPAVTETFNIMDVPGVALYVKTPDQLHIGFAKNENACDDNVSGDYTFIRSGLGLNENFGMYRSDSNFINISHSDFGFRTTGATITPTVVYSTGTESNVLVNSGCADGVRTRSTESGITIRSMMTHSGLFVLDFPAGQGGILSFKTDNAATLADFANKSFGGISFPDNDDSQPFNINTMGVSTNKVALEINKGGTTQDLNIMSLATTSSLSNPAYPDFSTVPADYNASVMSVSYTAPTDFPGLFKLDNLSDNGRIIIAAMKFSGKVIGIGMVYNYRTTADINPADGNPFPEDNLYNTGNFLLFEK